MTGSTARPLRIAICTLSQPLHAPTGLLGYFAQLARFLPAVDPAAEYHFIVSAATRDWIGGAGRGAVLHEIGWDDSNRPLRLFSEHVLLGRWLARNRIDVLYMANAGISPLLLPRRVCLVQAVFAFHQFARSEIGWARRLYRRVFFRRSLERAARIVLNSQYSRGLLKAVAPEHVRKSVIIPHGLDERLFHDGPISIAEAASLAALGIRPPYLLFVSQIYPYKDLDCAVEAFGRFASTSVADARLVLVGRFDRRFGTGEPYRRKLLVIAARLGIADRLVFIDSLPVGLLRAAYRGANCYIQTSRAETFGKTSLEAMACGCPVIAATAGATPEVVADAGLYFPPGDAAECARLITGLDGDPVLRRTLSARGIARAAEHPFGGEAAALATIFHEVGGSVS